MDTPTSPGLATKAAGLLNPVSSQRMSEHIVTQIRTLIREGKLTQGDRLPSERELCSTFGVSRVTVREALRFLEANGLIAVRVGGAGGAFVTAPTSHRVGEGIVDLMAVASLTALEVTEARMVFELGIVEMVCERSIGADLDELYRICDASDQAMAEGTYTFELSAAWHTAYARSAHNRAVSVFVESLHDPLLRSLETARSNEPVHGHRGIGEHRALTDAIRDRDAERATDLMRAHLARTAARVADRPSDAAVQPDDRG